MIAQMCFGFSMVLFVFSLFIHLYVMRTYGQHFHEENPKLDTLLNNQNRLIKTAVFLLFSSILISAILGISAHS